LFRENWTYVELYALFYGCRRYHRVEAIINDQELAPFFNQHPLWEMQLRIDREIANAHTHSLTLPWDVINIIHPIPPAPPAVGPDVQFSIGDNFDIID
jgi:hypothetical protein